MRRPSVCVRGSVRGMRATVFQSMAYIPPSGSLAPTAEGAMRTVCNRRAVGTFNSFRTVHSSAPVALVAPFAAPSQRKSKE